MVKRHRTLVSGGVAGLILVAVSLLAVLGPATPAQAQIDISGAWDFEILGFGPEAIPCPSMIVQNGATFTIDVECRNIGFGDFVGDIDVETGEFTASGTIASLPIELAGTASPDGETIEGTWDASSIGLSGTLTATRTGPVQTPTPLPTLSSPVDLTGTWRVEFRGIFSGTCESVIVQTGTELVSLAQCSILGTVNLTGTLSPLTGAFTLSSSLVTLDGVVGADGNRWTGTWSALGFGGTISGERVDDIELIDVSGQWDAVLLGDVSDTCALEIEQDLLAASAVLDCEGLDARSLEGTVNPFSGFLSLSETLGDIETSLSGRLGPDGSYIFGREFVGPMFLSGGASRTFIAVPAGALERGIVLLNCRPEAELMANNCFYGGGVGEPNEFPVAIQVAVAPVGGYGGLDASVSWPDAFAFRSGSSSTCETASFFGAGSSVMLSCIYVSHGDFVGSVFTLTLACDPGGTGDISLSDTSFQDLDEDLGSPTLINATVTCLAPQRSGPGQLIGDADCSFEVSSIDAALVLQYDAGLLETLDCLAGADVNRDGNVNSIDAVLILQDVAGLL